LPLKWQHSGSPELKEHLDTPQGAEKNNLIGDKKQIVSVTAVSEQLEEYFYT